MGKHTHKTIWAASDLRVGQRYRHVPTGLLADCVGPATVTIYHVDGTETTAFAPGSLRTVTGRPPLPGERIGGARRRATVPAPAQAPAPAPAKLPKKGGWQHASFDALDKLVDVRDRDGHRVNAYLHGPAGTGKTAAARKIAEARGLQLRAIGTLSDRYELSGHSTADGSHTETEFLRGWRDGGVILLDEIDRSAPDALVWLNMALANGVAPFPGGMVRRHPDCVIIGTGNTRLSGGDATYSTAQRMDGASADRWVFLEWEIDPALEELLAEGNAAWLARVRRVREAARDRGIGTPITPRAVAVGAALLRAGFTQAAVENMVIFGTMSDDIRGALRNA